MSRGALAAILLGLLACGEAAAGEPRYPGTYSSLRYNSEGADLLGMELRILPVPAGYQGIVQFAEGSPGFVTIVDVQVSDGEVRFSMPSPNRNVGVFVGKVSKEGIVGVFTMENGNRSEFNLVRGCSYWDKPRR